MRVFAFLVAGLVSGAAAAQSCSALVDAVESGMKAYSAESISIPGANINVDLRRLPRAAIALNQIGINLRLMEAAKCPPINVPVGPIYSDAAHKCEMALLQPRESRPEKLGLLEECDRKRWVRNAGLPPFVLTPP